MSELSNVNRESRLLGLELHMAETAIHAGKQAVREVLSEEPVDLAALEAHRASMHDARLVRNGLRRELEVAKVSERPWPSYSWH